MSTVIAPPSLSFRFTMWLGHCITRSPRLWVKLGNMESALLADTLSSRPIVSPVFVCGLARSGSTLLLETLASHKDATSHRYQDFPFLFTPYWWNMALRCNPFQSSEKRERAHGDGIMVNAASPEAMEEILWNAFFPELHTIPARPFPDTPAGGEAFERFYRQHIQKLLLARKASRYVSKGNYNVIRMLYLLRLFPDARFVIPIRNPLDHIASLMQQHERSCAIGRDYPQMAGHMSNTGHYEFGPNRTTMHTGEQGKVEAILKAWESGNEVLGWALQWDMIYSYVHRLLNIHPALAQSALVVPFEQQCTEPEDTLRRILSHCRLDADSTLISSYCARIRPATSNYPISEPERALIAEVTGATAGFFGY